MSHPKDSEQLLFLLMLGVQSIPTCFRFLKIADGGRPFKPLEECFSPAARDRGDAARMEKAVVRVK